jgi:hypothetical protein
MTRAQKNISRAVDSRLKNVFPEMFKSEDEPTRSERNLLKSLQLSLLQPPVLLGQKNRSN